MTSAPIDTRTAILEAARARLLADGYEGLSTRKVAQEAQLLKFYQGEKIEL